MIYLRLFFEFFKIGLFTFGGGYAMIPLIKEACEKHAWIAEDQFYNFLGICESTPGPIAINMATFIGTNQAGFLGAVIATLGVITPPFIIIVLIASVLKRFIGNKYVKEFLNGIKPVIIGLILSTGIIMFIKCIGFISLSEFDFSLVSVIITIILLLMMVFTRKIMKKRIDPILFICISAFLGIAIGIMF